MLRQAENLIEVEGILSEIDLKYGSYKKDDKTVETVGGTIKVLVEDNDSAREITAHLFSGKYTTKGAINPAYTSIEEVMNSFVSIAASSKETADRIRFRGQLKMNEYSTNDGKIISQPRVTTSFVNKITNGKFTPKANFTMAFMVSDVHRVVDGDGVEVDPAKLEVTAVVPQYGGKVDVCKFYATKPNVIEGIESSWEPGNTYRAAGYLNFASTTTVVKEDFGFGDTVEKVKTSRVSEFVITSGSPVPLEGEFAYDVEEIKAAMAERKARLEAEKNKPQTKTTPAQTSTKGKLDLGF